MKNIKSFVFKIVEGKSFTLKFEGVAFLDTIVMTLRAGVTTISYTLTSLKNAVTSISITNPITYIGKLLSNFEITSSITNPISYVMSETSKLVTSLGLSKSIVYNGTVLVGGGLSLTKNIAMVFSSSYGYFTKLYEIDPDTLATLDSDTLGDIEFTAA